MEKHELFCDQLVVWLSEKGFKNDRGWHKPGEKGETFYSFVKGDYRFEIKINWDKRYSDWYSPIIVNFIDCSKEWWGEPMNCLMWMGQTVLHSFKKPFKESMFIEICDEHEL